MNYSLTGQQAFFFEKNGFIEFEHLLDDDEIRTLSGAINASKQPRNLSHTHPQVRKILFSKGMAELASRLSLRKKLRFGFDQAVFHPQLQSGFSVANSSCIAPLGICLMLCISGEQQGSSEVQPEAIDPFPSKPGNGVFFLPNRPWSASCFENHKDQKCLLLAYADEKVQYLYCLEDPFLHDLKKEGLVFGDTLPEKTHPFLYR